MDVERSVDALLAGQGSSDSSDSSDNSSSSRARQQQQPGGPTVDTQLRGRDAAGRLLVRFQTPGAAQQALKAAVGVARAAAAAAGGAGPVCDSGFVGSSASGASGDGLESYAVAVTNGGVGGSAGYQGGWFIDVFHAAVHRSIESAAGAMGHSG